MLNQDSLTLSVPLLQEKINPRAPQDLTRFVRHRVVHLPLLPLSLPLYLQTQTCLSPLIPAAKRTNPSKSILAPNPVNRHQPNPKTAMRFDSRRLTGLSSRRLLGTRSIKCVLSKSGPKKEGSGGGESVVVEEARREGEVLDAIDDLGRRRASRGREVVGKSVRLRGMNR